MTATFRIYLDKSPATDAQLDLVRAIRVDQAIGVAAEAELDLDLTLDDQGRWSGIEDDFAQPFRRVRIEVKVGDQAFAPLIDGPIVGQRFELGAAPAENRMTLVVHDDSVALNRTEEAHLFEDMAPHEIARALIVGADLAAQVESVAAAGSALTRYEVQRGTAMHLLRDLARRHGMFVYVKPGAAPGQSVVVFAHPALARADLPPLLLLGPDRNIHAFSVQFDALQPLAARAAAIRIADLAVLRSATDKPDLTALGEVGVHDTLPAPAVCLLAHTREEQNDLDAATASAVNLSSFAYTASTEIDANDYPAVLAPYQVISVAGPGAYLGGAYLISRVHHVLDHASYKQHLTLKRNARSAGSQARRGGIPAGVF